MEKNKTRIRTICRLIEIIRTKDHGYIDVITDRVNIEVELVKHKPVISGFTKQIKPIIHVRDKEEEFVTIMPPDDVEIKAVEKIIYPRMCAICGKEYKTQKTFETHIKKCG